MSRNNCIQAECEADTVLVEVLGFKKPGHQQGVHNVMNAFKNYPSTLIIGVIDRDKRQPSKIVEFEEAKSFQSIVLLRHKTQRQHIIITHPNLDDWLYIHESKVTGVNPIDFGFNSRNYFHEVAKSKEVLKNKDFRNFINAIKQKSKTLQILQNWLEELVI